MNNKRKSFSKSFVSIWPSIIALLIACNIVHAYQYNNNCTNILSGDGAINALSQLRSNEAALEPFPLFSSILGFQLGDTEHSIFNKMYNEHKTISWNVKAQAEVVNSDGSSCDDMGDDLSIYAMCFKNGAYDKQKGDRFNDMMYDEFGQGGPRCSRIYRMPNSNKIALKSYVITTTFLVSKLLYEAKIVFYNGRLCYMCFNTDNMEVAQKILTGLISKYDAKHIYEESEIYLLDDGARKALLSSSDGLIKISYLDYAEVIMQIISSAQSESKIRKEEAANKLDSEIESLTGGSVQVKKDSKTVEEEVPVVDEEEIVVEEE